MSYKLRPYQNEAIEKARESFKKGNKKICLALATGAGKSVITKIILENASNNGFKVLYLTFRNVLINQMKEYFKGTNIEFGTLQKFGKESTEYYDLVLIDEVHWAYGSKLQNNINCKYLIGLSATPIKANGDVLEFDEIIDIVQMKDLIDLGFAAPVKVLSTSKVNTDNLKVTAGDFNVKETYKLMANSEIKKDIVNTYNKHAKGLKTIIYCVNIAHAEEMKQEFLKAGINCESVHSKKDSESIIKKFRDNEIQVLTNCDILTTGVDLPDIYCLILASPTKSVIKATQIYGRATRLNHNDPNKIALIIDCSNVVHDTQHPLQKFDFTKKKKDKDKKICKCGADLLLIDKKTKMIDDYSYCVTSFYKCNSCDYESQQEDLKTINYSFCESCNTVLTAGYTMKQEANEISFVLECERCGYEHKKRQILLNEKELEEIRVNDVLNSYTWEAVELILKAEAKANKYKWQWVNRAIEILKNKKLEPKYVIEQIKVIKSRGKKIGSIVYV